MKRFNITVNGKAYDVAVEEITDGSAPVVATPVATAPKTVSAPAPAPAQAPAGEGEKVTAPMPGNILDVKVSVGDSVTKGQVLMVLEAMKMENEIVAPCDGKVTSVTVKKGDTVNSSDTLATVQ
jgi:biotin carboxyl carrier protein